jgi:Polysaccharide lyase
LQSFNILHGDEVMNTRSLAILSIIGAWLTGGIGCARAEEVIRDFETNSLSGLKTSGNPPTVQSSIKRLGRYAMRSDLDRFNSPVMYRTEVRVLAPPAIVNQEYWYGFSIYLPDSYVPDHVAWEMVAQWHGIPDDGDRHGNPPLSLSTSRGVWKLSNRWSSQRIQNSSNIQSRSFVFGPYATGRWTDWVFRIKWSYGSQGILEVWQNGKKVVSANGPNTYNDARMPSFKMGIYKGWKAGGPVGPVTHRTLYHDEFRRVGPGGSYSDVAPSTQTTTLQAPSQFTVD